MSASEAYLKSGYTTKNPDVCGAKLLGKVGKRIDEIRVKSAELCRISKRELLEFLADAVQTPAGNVTSKDKLCQSIKITEQGTELKIPDKLKAAEMIAKMCGYNEPDELNLSASDSLTQLLTEIRAGK
jgi:hypothetical protein